MRHLPSIQDDQLLNEIRAALIKAQHQFREQICHLLQWSLTTFYENTMQARDYDYQDTLTMLQLFARIIENLESILIAMCEENGFVYGIQVMVNWYKKE